jgi:hypothetical protein
MAYLRLFDYYRSIQDAQLQQVISSNDSIRLIAEIEAQAEAISYLTQKYDTESEFSDTTIFDATISYKANSLIELNFDEYLSTNNYIPDDLVIYVKNAYICTANTTGTFAPAKWTLIGKQYDLFFATIPEMEFNYRHYYLAGEKVFFKNKVYTALKPSPIIDQQTSLQYSTTNAIPLPNVFPDDSINGLTYWGVGTPYAVAAGTLPTDTLWTKGDNRSIQLVYKIVDICLFNLHSRIAPKNIPQLRMDRYAAAIAWLDMAKAGEITADIPLRQPKQGARMRWSSQPRNINNY